MQGVFRRGELIGKKGRGGGDRKDSRPTRGCFAGGCRRGRVGALGTSYERAVGRVALELTMGDVGLESSDGKCEVDVDGGYTVIV